MGTTVNQVRADLPHLVTSLPGPRAQAIIARDRQVVSPSYTRCYPLAVERGEGAMVEDVDGNRYLDFNAGIAVVATGHCHPRVVDAIQKQAANLIHMSGTDFYYEGMVGLAEKLAEIAPGDSPRRVSFGNSGAEAMEGAIKLARYASGREKLIAFYGGFHGRTMGALSLTASKATQRAGFGPLVPGVVHAPYPYCYRCPFGKEPEDCAVECVKFIEDTLLKTVAPADEVAAIAIEPVQGEGGYIVPPQKFFDELRRVAKAHRILLILDEVQSGMGRTGKMWAAEHFGVDPDIFAVAKGIASGMPLGATVARADLMTWPPGAHASTFGGNPVSCAAALTTIALLQEELVENARRMGEHLMARLRDWPRRFPNVGDVRGLGLMIGIELVKNQETREKFPQLRDKLEDLAYHRGLLVLGAGDCTIRLCPPLVISRDQCDFAVETLEECLTSLTS
ncbi:MAG TPA: acetyl ornithine aminotransferase family protein [Candidatus Limnocylindrales bacterium]|nr:acetyl ornithine aminotransferase family protein [Candidatus Limnocylindrales bacterium]